jgi:hypothetical protein
LRRPPYRAVTVEDLLAADRVARRRSKRILWAFLLVVVLVWIVFRLAIR